MLKEGKKVVWIHVFFYSDCSIKVIFVKSIWLRSLLLKQNKREFKIPKEKLSRLERLFKVLSSPTELQHITFGRDGYSVMVRKELS